MRLAAACLSFLVLASEARFDPSLAACSLVDCLAACSLVDCLAARSLVDCLAARSLLEPDFSAPVVTFARAFLSLEELVTFARAFLSLEELVTFAVLIFERSARLSTLGVRPASFPEEVDFAAASSLVAFLALPEEVDFAAASSLLRFEGLVLTGRGFFPGVTGRLYPVFLPVVMGLVLPVWRC